MIRIGDICDQICRMVGIPQRVVPNRAAFSKKELERVLSHLTILHSKMEELEREDVGGVGGAEEASEESAGTQT